MTFLQQTLKFKLHFVQHPMIHQKLVTKILVKILFFWLNWPDWALLIFF